MLARIDEDINSCTELVSYLEEQANTCFEAFMTLERESNREYAAMHAYYSTYHRAVKDNHRSEGHLSNVVVKFRDHISLD